MFMRMDINCQRHCKKYIAKCNTFTVVNNEWTFFCWIFTWIFKVEYVSIFFHTLLVKVYPFYDHDRRLLNGTGFTVAMVMTLPMSLNHICCQIN